MGPGSNSVFYFVYLMTNVPMKHCVRKTLFFRIIYEIIFSHSLTSVSYSVLGDILIHFAYSYKHATRVKKEGKNKMIILKQKDNLHNAHFQK